MRTTRSKWWLVSTVGVCLALVAATATVALSAVSVSAAKCSPTITKAPFGSVGGQAVDRYTLTNCDQMEVKVLTYGGILQTIVGARPPEPARERHARLRQPRGLRRARARTSAASPAATPTGSPTAGSPSTASPTSCRSTTRRTRCTAATVGFDKHVWAATPFEHGEDRRPRHDVHEPRRRPGLPRHARRPRSPTR